MKDLDILVTKDEWNFLKLYNAVYDNTQGYQIKKNMLLTHSTSNLWPPP